MCTYQLLHKDIRASRLRLIIHSLRYIWSYGKNIQSTIIKSKRKWLLVRLYLHLNSHKNIKSIISISYTNDSDLFN